MGEPTPNHSFFNQSKVALVKRMSKHYQTPCIDSPNLVIYSLEDNIEIWGMG